MCNRDAAGSQAKACRPANLQLTKPNRRLWSIVPIKLMCCCFLDHNMCTLHNLPWYQDACSCYENTINSHSRCRTYHWVNTRESLVTWAALSPMQYTHTKAAVTPCNSSPQRLKARLCSLSSMRNSQLVKHWPGDRNLNTSLAQTKPHLPESLVDFLLVWLTVRWIKHVWSSPKKR